MNNMERQGEQRQQRPRRSGCLAWFFYSTWYPFNTMRSIVITSLVVGIVLLILAVTQVIVYQTAQQTNVEYASVGECKVKSQNNKCEVTFDIKEEMPAPVNILYEIDGAYINHRRYIESVSNQQLMGKTIDMDKAQKKCKPFVTNAEGNKTQSYFGNPLQPDFVSSPCGFVAHLVFNDTFKIYDEGGSQIAVDSSDLYSNQYGEFKRASDSATTQWIDPQNQHFMVWMRKTARTTKLKLWGRINQALQPGKYNLVADNNFRVGDMKLHKGVRLISGSAFGGALYFYPWVFGILGVLCIAYAILLRCKFPDYDHLAYAFQMNMKLEDDE